MGFYRRKEVSTMKWPILLGVLAVVFALTVSAIASPSTPSDDTDLVLYLGQVYCLQMDWCPDFAFYGAGTPVGYVELTEPDGTPSDYLWVDHQGFLTFESDPLTISPPAGLPLLGKLVEDGTLQEVDQFFPGGGSRPLYMQSGTDDGATLESSAPGLPAPEPSTLLLFIRQQGSRTVGRGGIGAFRFGTGTDGSKLNRTSIMTEFQLE